MKPTSIAAALLFALPRSSSGDVPHLVITPGQDPEAVVRVIFRTARSGFYFCSIKDDSGRLVRFIATGPCGACQHGIDWDAKDMSGNIVPVGEYGVYLSEGIRWRLDRDFGTDGRILFERPGLDGDIDSPWAIALDENDDLYVLLHWQPPALDYRQGKLAKYHRDGKSLDQSFGSAGIVSDMFAGHHVVISSEDKRIYVAGSHDWTHGVGVYSLETGAELYFIGGYADGGEPHTTVWAKGLVLGRDNRLYIRSSTIKVYDRTQERLTGFLYSGDPFFNSSPYPPLLNTYWGPCLEKARGEGTFYGTTAAAEIVKVTDIDMDLHPEYSLRVPGNPVGMALDSGRDLLFAALRTTPGKVAVVFDSRSKLQESGFLEDDRLGPVHALAFRNDYLYVVEDGDSPLGYALREMTDFALPSQGQARVSRYKIRFGPTRKIAVIRRR